MVETSELPRKHWMAVLAKAAPLRLAELMPDLPAHTLLRAPEIGAVMVRGRAGGTGEAFNLGEMTVTRASVRLGCGTVGHAWVQGRDKGHALRAAVADAVLQTADAGQVQAKVIDPLVAEAREAARSRAETAATTKVDFFTMVRGEDA
ncbi:MAG: phosphonate C-P lyase system protein PhnG [Rhodobacterales bacterium 32-66-7]|nr:MAG: phosphonate C-P lyase system protein PhnG [Rhodobacterales bacterium 32-66-7]